MNIEKTEQNGETTLRVVGCLDTAAVPEFAEALAAVETAPTLVLDFTNLEFIASSGLRALVLANKKAAAAGRTIAITGMNEVVADVFDVTGLAEVFARR